MPFARARDTDIFWKVEGIEAYPPLVLLNSIGTDMDLWDAALPLLRRRFALLRIDTRGHGASGVSEGDYDLSLLAGDVAAAMRAAGIPHAPIAGVSLGGMIAMQLALEKPAFVRGLALICTSASMDRAAWAARVDAVRADGLAGIVDLAMSRFLSPEFIVQRPDIAASIRRGLLTMSPVGYAGCAAAIRDMTLADRCAAIAAPTLVISGSRDMSTPFAAHGAHLLACIAGARHVQLDAAHLAPIEAPAHLAAALADFFLPEVS